MTDSTKQLREDLDWYVQRVAHYGEENARLRADNQTLRSFARLIIQEGPWQGADLDGGTIQEWAETAGLIKCVPFDPEKHITRSNYEDIVDVGEDWYVLAGPLAPASCDGNMTYEKMRKDGNVAVLYSPGYGAGWFTWNSSHPGLVFDREIVEAVLAGDRDAAAEIAERKYPDGYFGGADDLKVMWLKEGSAFEITEYDGFESVHVIGDHEYLVA